MSKLLILLLFIVAHVAMSEESPSLVIEFFRHGARSPSDKIDHTWKTHDELIDVGMRQHYILGQIIAKTKRYSQLVDEYNASHIYVRSTDFNRTLQSAQSQLRGIFEKKGPSLPANPNFTFINPPWDDSDTLNNIDEELRNVTTALPNSVAVIPVHTVPLDKDRLLYLGPSNCPNTVEWYKQRPTDANAMKVFNSLSDTTTYLKEKGYTVKVPFDYFLIGDTVVANHFANKDLPPGIIENSQVYNDTLFSYQWFVNYVYVGTGDQLIVYDYAISNKILEFFQQKAQKQTDLKFIMMSGHDSTLTAVLGLFDVVTPDCLIQNHQDTKAGKPHTFPHCKFPGYASQIFFEYYDAVDEKGPYIKFVYNSESIDICKVGENNKCYLTKFNEVIKNKIKIDQDGMDVICGTKKPPSGDDNWIKIIQYIVLALLCVLGAGLIVGIVYILVKNKKQKPAAIDSYHRINEINDPEVNLNHE